MMLLVLEVHNRYVNIIAIMLSVITVEVINNIDKKANNNRKKSNSLSWTFLTYMPFYLFTVSSVFGK